MATIKSKAERSRALGVALTGKAARQMERRPFPPGEHGRGGRRHDSDSGLEQQRNGQWR